MARGVFTFLLAVAGSIIAGPVGGAVGTMLGAQLDNQLFPQKVVGPRLDDLMVTTSTYGKAIGRLYGPECRTGGNIIWSTGLIEVKKKHRDNGKGGPASVTTEYTYNLSCAVALSARQITGVQKIYANSKVIFDRKHHPFSEQYDAGDTQKVFKTLRVYPGDQAQIPDPLIEGVLGVGNVPAYRGTAYVVIDTLQLADFGNRIPNFEMLVCADETITVGEVIEDIIVACGLDPELVSIPGMEDLRGYVINTEASGVGALQPLAFAYDFDVAEVAGALRIIPRGAGPVASIDDTNLAGRQVDGDRPDRIKWSRAIETSLPREAAITFLDPERDYQVNTQTARRFAGSAQNNLSMTVPIVLTVEEGRAKADRALYEAWTSRETALAVTDDRLIDLEPGRVYCFPTAAGWEPLKVTRKTRGADGIIEIELRRDRSEIYSSTSGAAHARVPANVLKLPGPTTLVLLDIPMLQDADNNSGFYFAIAGTGDGWRGADVIRSVDGGSTYDEVAPVGIEAIMGRASGFLPTQTSTWDDVTEITITLDDPADLLESVDEENALAARNAIWIGPDSGRDGEIIFFQDATETSPGVFVISRLLRGRDGTNQDAWMTHPPDHRAVMLQKDVIQRVDYGPADLNKDRKYKAVSLLDQADDATAQDFTNQGVALKPLSPVHPQGWFDAAGDLHLAWVRRTRFSTPGIGNGVVTLGEEVEAYLTRIARVAPVSDPGTTVRRTWLATPEQLYTQAQQVDDGYGPGDTLQILVYQMRTAEQDNAGAGTPLLVTLTVPL